MSHKKWRIHTCVLGVVLLSVVMTGRAGRLGAQEGGLFTAPPELAQDQAQPRQGKAEVRSRRVGIDTSRLPGSVAADRADRLTFNLFDDVTLVAEIDRITSNGSNSKTYVGRVEGLADHVDGVADNTVTLVVGDGVMIGTVNTPSRAYVIRFDGQSHVVREIDTNLFPDEMDPTPSAQMGAVVDNKEVPGQSAEASDVATPVTAAPPAENPDAAAADSPGRVDVMILYTATARAAAGGTTAMRNLITQGVDETNQMYTNSGVGTRMRLVHMAEVSYTESGNAQTDRDRLFNGSDGQLDVVHTWRNTYGADMVQMLVNNAGGGCGIAFLNGPAASMPSQSAYAYAVTDWQCVTPNYTFAHEFGHIQGNNHAPDDPTGTGAYSYSFGFKRCTTTPYFRSVMAYACPSGATGTQRSLNFSNPNVNVNGAPTGTASQNNALSMFNTRQTISNFRTEQPLVRITSLWPPADAADLTAGKITRLWAYVVNDGPYPLPASARVWFWTDGPGSGPGEGWVGSMSVSGLAPNTGAWYYYDFTIPNNAVPGSWVYWARVYDSAGAGEYLSNWAGPQAFTVRSVQGTVLSLWPVSATQAGNTATLWARVQNTGTAAFPSGTIVRYWVAGPGFSNYVGSASVAGLATGGTAWYAFNWSIPVNRTGGAHNYWAILEYTSAGLTRNISSWQGPQAFTVVSAPAYSANIDSLWTVSKPTGGAPQRGFPVRLWGLTRNNGLNAHDANTFTYFWVTGPAGGVNGYVCSQTSNGLASGGSVWRYCDWTIPAGAPLGAYSYRAISWRWTGSAWQQLSPWSVVQNFSVASDQALPAAAADSPGKQ